VLLSDGRESAHAASESCFSLILSLRVRRLRCLWGVYANGDVCDTAGYVRDRKMKAKSRVSSLQRGSSVLPTFSVERGYIGLGSMTGL
jgi:hypothetical protein